MIACAPKPLVPDPDVAARVSRVMARDRHVANWPDGYRIDRSDGTVHLGALRLSDAILRSDVTLSNGEKHRSGASCDVTQDGSDLTVVCSNLLYRGTAANGTISLTTTVAGGVVTLVGVASSADRISGTVEGHWDKRGISITSGEWELVAE
jgi:hypothetical protein